MDILIQYIVQTIFGLLLFYLFILIDSCFHENGHAKKAEQLHPEIKTVLFIFCYIRHPHKHIKGNRTIYYLPNSCKNELYTTSCMQVEDNFASFSNEEIVATAKSGLYSTGIVVFVMSAIGFVFKIPMGILFIVSVSVICMFRGMKGGRNQEKWNDFRAIYCPSEYREHAKSVYKYNEMIEYGEKCIREKDKF